MLTLELPEVRRTRYRLVDTRHGPFAIVLTTRSSLEAVWLDRASRRRLDDAIEDRRLLPELAARVRAYFCGEAVSFDDVPLPHGPEFYRRCWAACRAIPRGETLSYARLAHVACGSASAARAAGQAMRRNPMPIITPCHRVIGSDGALHGFAGSTARSGRALSLKRALLDLEAGLCTAP
jgi:methylated-DNA-[protein]-cysteine S-methyltransferase